MAENILFIRLRLLGDIIFTIPSIRLYKNSFPENKIIYVVEEDFKGIGELIPDISHLIVIPRKMKLKDYIEFRKKVKSFQINTAIDFHSGPKSALLTFISGANLRIGYKTPNRNWAFNRLTPRKHKNHHTHSVHNQARLLKHLGIKTDDIPGYPEIILSENGLSGLIKKSIKQNKKIVIHVGAGNKFRDWGIKNFSMLIKRLKTNGFNISVIGNNEEEKIRGTLFKEKYKTNDFTGKLSLKETLYLISKSQVYFGVDSGPLHLATLTKTPIVALYGPNIPEISGPWRPKYTTILQKKLNCQPCSQRKCIYDKIRCMQEIKVDEVYEAITEYLC